MAPAHQSLAYCVQEVHRAHSIPWGHSTWGARCALRFQVSFLSRIELRQDWGDEQTHEVNTFELFFDLLYVAVAFKLGDFLSSHLTVKGIFISMMYVLLFVSTWGDITGFLTRFRLKNATHSIILYIATCGVACMGLIATEAAAVDPHRKDDAAAVTYLHVHQNDVFAVGYVITRVALFLLHVVLYITNRRARRVAFYGMVVYAVEGVVWAIVPVLPEAPVIAIMAATPVAHYVVLMWAIPSKGRVPLNIHHYSERQGELILVFLGESVIGLLTPTPQHTVSFYLVVLFGFTAIAGLRHIYFSAQPHNPDNHALRVSKNRGRAFAVAHLVLCCALLGIGTALKLFVKHCSYGHPKPDEACLLSVSLAVALLIMNVIRMIHICSQRWYVWAVRAVLLVSVAVQPLYSGHISPPVYLLIVAAHCTGLTLADLAGRDVTGYSSANTDRSQSIVTLTVDPASDPVSPDVSPLGPLPKDVVRDSGTAACKFSKRCPQGKLHRLFTKDTCNLDL